MLGLPGAYAADLLHRAIGWAAWGLPLTFGVWGLRFLLHRGEERFLSRIFLAPFAISLGAVFAAAHAPLDGWQYDFGLGGWFGDAVLGGILSSLPGNLDLTLVLVTIALLAGLLALACLALGATWREAAQMWAFTASGFGLLARGTAKAGRGSAQMARNAMEKRKAKRDAPQKAIPKPGEVKNRLTFGLGRQSAPEDADTPRIDANPELAATPAEQDDAVLMARISAAIRAREKGGAADIAADEPGLGGVTRENPVPEDMLDLPPVDGGELGRASSGQKVRADRVKPVRKSKSARAEEQPRLALGDVAAEPYIHPPLALLEDPANVARHVPSSQALEDNARMLESVLDDYGVKGEIVSVRPGPVVTMYELEPAPGLKASRVIGLSDDIARSMSALTARVSTVPGRSVIGIELPNAQREKVVLREILSAAAYGDSGMRLPLALGKDISGEPIVANLARMPHLLIAGTTGSGKSVAINTMILSLLYQLSPEECRLIMIDPKMLELSASMTASRTCWPRSSPIRRRPSSP